MEKFLEKILNLGKKNVEYSNPKHFWVYISIKVKYLMFYQFQDTSDMSKYSFVY